MSIGDMALYSAFVTGLAAIMLLIINHFREEKNIDKPLKWMIRVFSGLLIFDFLLLTYYFLTTNLIINYVWTFSSRDLPILYKLSGVLAGQQGTLLFWALFIGISSLWLSERRESSDFIKKTQIIVLTLGVFFIGLTLQESPFKTIYLQYPDIPPSFLPPDGNGLNPLLIDPWMAVHPPVIFIAYAAMTVPFALAVVYLFNSLKDPSGKSHHAWIKDVIMWCRISWIFLTLGIAIGGFWAYKVLGWGGFWAWDPVETSSIVPWFLLTGALHALVEHKKERLKYSILAPLLVALSFTLILYATLVTRSGFFESVHAFDAGSSGFYILIITIISGLVPIALAVLNTKTEEHIEDEEKVTLVNRTNIFYIAIVLFIIFTFVSFWGITFPAISRLSTGNKIGIGASFFNIWSYPIIIAAMLVAALGLNYKPSTKEKSIREFLAFLVMTVAAGFIKPTDAWNLVNYSAIVNPDKPLFYSLIGSISILSFIPPSIYLLYSAINRFKTRLTSPKKGYIAKELGITIIHIGVALIVIGSVFSYAVDSEFSVTINSDEEGKLTQISESPYSVKLLGFETLNKYKTTESSFTYPGISVEEFYDGIHNELLESYTIHGIVREIVQTPHNTYLKLVDGEEELWMATSTVEDVTEDVHIAATGIIALDFKSTYLNTTFSVLFLTPNFDVFPEKEIFSTTKRIKLAVYNGNNEIGRGIAESVKYFNGDVQKVMIDRGIKGDVYVIPNGIEGRKIFLDVRIKPLVNFVWAGVIFFTLGMLSVLVFDSTSKRRK